MMAEGGVPQYTCDICCQEGLTKEDMKTHVLMAHMNGAIVCPFCDLEGTAAEEMNLHVNMEHLNYLSPTMDNTAEMDIDDSSPTSDPSEPQVSSPESSDGIILSNGNDGCSSAASATSKDSDESNDYALEITITEPKSSPKKDLYGSMVPGSPTSCPEQNHKRAKLHLDVPFVHKNVNKTNEVVKRKVESQENRKNQENENENVREHRFLCPLCDWYTSSPGEIMRHVNDVHVDILSPNKNKCQQQHQQPLQQRTDSENNIIDNFEKPSTSSAVFECPICGLHTTSSSSLEVHVNTKHADILSPSGRPASLAISPDSLTEGLCCPVCGMEFCDTNDLAVHVDGHFSGDQTPVSDTMDSLLAQELERREKEALKVQEMKEFEKLQEMYGVTGKGNYQKQAEEDLDRAVIKGQLNVSDYYARKADILQSSAAGIDDGHSCTKGLLGRLKSYYKSCSNSTVCRVWLCSPCDHFASSYGDKGWGCGYRNLQMLLSCLSQNPTFEQVLFNGRAMIPSIPKIQRLIETAWQKGFDLQGCEQLGGKVINTTKWIGATEIVATLSSLKIKCQLVDFHGPAGKDGTHPRLFEWVRDYFRSDGTDFKPPLYLQHQGHSRTITGIEELKDGSLRLLLFDPSCSRKQMQQFLGDIDANLMRCIRRSLHSMRAKQYQIVAVVDILPDQEYEESKMLKSERIH